MRIAWSGQHTHGKALPVLLKALRLAIDGGVSPQSLRLDVLGVGAMTASWKSLAQKLGLSEIIKWHGWVQKDVAEGVVAESDIFVITSLRDLTSAVLMEAIGRGKPVACIDHCGFATAIDDTCGIKVPVGKADEVIKGFADAIVRLMDDGLRGKLSKGALARAEKYRWSENQNALRNVLKAHGKKVLVSAYACSPYRGSEPGMGWHYLQAVAEGNEVWAVVEQEKWQKDIERYCAEHDDAMTKVHWIFIHKPRARWLRKIWPPSYYWFYRIWQWRAFKMAEQLNSEKKFDLVYQLTMTGFREPGYLWRLDVPFAWGPIGGLGYTDWRLLPLAGFAGYCEFAMRNVINWLHCHLLVRPRKAARRAAQFGMLMSSTGEIADEAKKLWGVDSTVICENGV